MPSSSLFLRSSATLVSALSLLSTPAVAQSPGVPNSLLYQLDKSYQGEDFFNKFNYFSDADPTHGFVTYVTKDTARQQGLASINPDGSFRMKVDSQTVLTKTNIDDYYNKNNVGRASVRIEGQDTWTKGLWIADFSHMPASTCGTWPAYWTLAEGISWPNGGEIDIVEGVSNRQRALAALHTGGQSKITGDSSTMTGELLTTDCNYNSPSTASNPTGCGVYDRRTDTYGDGFNSNGGRVVAMEWADDAIKVWSWVRGSEPSDIKSGSPLPGNPNWGTPAQVFSGSDVNIPANFKNHKIILDTTFCGDFTDAVWSSEGCAASTGFSTCAAFVGANPGAFSNAYWDINSIKVYQKKAQTNTTTTTSTHTSTFSSSSSSTMTTSVTTTSNTTTTTSSSHHYGNGTTTSHGPSSSGSGTTTNSNSATTSSHSHSRTSSTTSGSLTSNASSARASGTTSRSVTSTASSSSTSGSSWADWVDPKDQKTGNANPAVTGFPMGTGIVSSGSWGNWQTADAVTFITTTIRTTYVVPCSTGLQTKTATVTTSFVGGKQSTYTPAIPMTTYTTSCPAEWGFGGPITVTVPATQTITAYVPSATDGSKTSNGQGSGSNGSNGSHGNGNGDSNSRGSQSPSNANSAKQPASTMTTVVATPAAAISTSVQSSAQATGTGATDWSAWSNSNITNPIARFTGAGTRAGYSLIAGFVAMGAALLL